MFSRGVSLTNLEKFKGALKSFDQVLQLNPQHENAWCEKGNIFNEIEKHEEATKAYDQAIQLNPKNDVAFYGKISCISYS